MQMIFLVVVVSKNPPSAFALILLLVPFSKHIELESQLGVFSARL
jgi:hypothetical protein